MVSDKSLADIEVIVKVAGFPDGNLIIECNGWQECGTIKKGIGCRFETVRGGFVIDYKDLKNAIKKFEKELEAKEVEE